MSLITLPIADGEVFGHYKILDDPFLVANVPILSQTISDTIPEGEEVIKLHYVREFLLEWITNKWEEEIPIEMHKLYIKLYPKEDEDLSVMIVSRQRRNVVACKLENTMEEVRKYL